MQSETNVFDPSTLNAAQRAQYEAAQSHQRIVGMCDQMILLASNIKAEMATRASIENAAGAFIAEQQKAASKSKK